MSEAAIPDEIVLFYPEAGFSDEAEVLLRKALSLDPENQYRMNAQAYFLTDEDRNVK